ncbi:gastrula zinc finger protein XlCGF49.1-like [Rana temporaria]|uniref:gastrula zinc finger protein XlCGF49.1-like n=1 Tax=Rana temporaria TaxID=8407 RepID=UPI001AACC7E7|nr:gastrula zinc finger protein XlCGF49.1-like [Rana temporaria]
MEDEDITGDCGGEKTMSSTMDGGLHSVDRPWIPSDSEQPRTDWNDCGIRGDENFSCPKCGERFYSELSISIHQRSHKREKPYSKWGKCFAKNSDVYVQPRTHSGKKMYTCSECGKCYLRKVELDRHQTSHTGERPYSCPECGKAFPLKSSLRRHVKSHTGVRPYTCSECGKCFPERSRLCRHRKTHTGQKQ